MHEFSDYARLCDILQPGESNDLWDNYDPEQWWYCLLCNKVCQAKDFRVWREVGEDCEDTHCPFCQASSQWMFWYHGWLTVALDGWRPFPNYGDEFHLCRDWEGDEGPEEPGISLPPPGGDETVTKEGSETESHYPPLQGNGSGGFQGG